MVFSKPLPTHQIQPIVAGAGITFMLLAFMASLITFNSERSTLDNWQPTEIIQHQKIIEDNYKQHAKPPPKSKPVFKPAPPMAAINPIEPPFTPVTIDKSAITKSDQLTGVIGLKGIGKNLLGTSGNRSATLANPVAARYPAIAIDRNLEGYVDVIFDITPTGTTANVRVVAAEPARVFNRSAITAVKKWKYRPQVEGGAAVRVTGVVARVHFELEK